MTSTVSLWLIFIVNNFTYSGVVFFVNFHLLLCFYFFLFYFYKKNLQKKIERDKENEQC